MAAAAAHNIYWLSGGGWNILEIILSRRWRLKYFRNFSVAAAAAAKPHGLHLYSHSSHMPFPPLSSFSLFWVGEDVLERVLCMREGTGSGRYIFFCSRVLGGWCVFILYVQIRVWFWNKVFFSLHLPFLRPFWVLFLFTTLWKDWIETIISRYFFSFHIFLSLYCMSYQYG